jgi:phage gp36-like protein
MPYAAVTDMVALFGTTEIIRLSTQDGDPMTDINQTVVALALANASATMDTYLRKRYLVPVAVTLPELVNTCCIMARYQLAFGGDREPSEQMRLANKQKIEWLVDLRDGKNVLSGAVPSGDESFASMSDRGYTTFADDGDATGANVNSPPLQPYGYGRLPGIDQGLS